MNLKYLLDEPLAEWPRIFKGLGSEGFRARQAQDWIFNQMEDDFASMSNLPNALIEKLKTRYTLRKLEVDEMQTSEDGTIKWALKTSDGFGIECVLISEGKRRSACLSSQVGCAMGCQFCNTAKMGLLRNLSPGEIAEQFLIIDQYLKTQGSRLTNVIFMGMGEPLHNLESVAAACNVIASDQGFGLSKKRITVSTSGLVPEIGIWAEREPGIKLAISLNSSNDEMRGKLMPINKRYPMDSLLKAAGDYAKRTGQRITFEYVLISGVTTSPQAALELRKIASGKNCKVNLIPFNPGGAGGFRAPTPEEINGFKEILSKGRFPVLVRASKGRDISAACGQLVREQKKAA